MALMGNPPVLTAIKMMQTPLSQREFEQLQMMLAGYVHFVRLDYTRDAWVNFTLSDLQVRKVFTIQEF